MSHSYETYNGKTVESKYRLTKQQTAEVMRGVPVVQLDYFTGEYIGEYASYIECARDLDVGKSAINQAFRFGGAVAIVHKNELILMKKEQYENFTNTIPK